MQRERLTFSRVPYPLWDRVLFIKKHPFEVWDFSNTEPEQATFHGRFSNEETANATARFVKNRLSVKTEVVQRDLYDAAPELLRAASCLSSLTGAI